MAQGGKSHNDRILSADVRTLTLMEIKRCLTDKEFKTHPVEFYRQLILKLAGTVLPRLNEHTGAEGADLFPKPIIDVIQKNQRNTEDNQPQEAD